MADAPPVSIGPVSHLGTRFYHACSLLLEVNVLLVGFVAVCILACMFVGTRPYALAPRWGGDKHSEGNTSCQPSEGNPSCHSTDCSTFLDHISSWCPCQIGLTAPWMGQVRCAARCIDAHAPPQPEPAECRLF